MGKHDLFAFLMLINNIFEKLRDRRFILKCMKLTKNENLPLFPVYNEKDSYLCRLILCKKRGVLLPYIATQVENLTFFLF